MVYLDLIFKFLLNCIKIWGGNSLLCREHFFNWDRQRKPCRCLTTPREFVVLPELPVLNRI